MAEPKLARPYYKLSDINGSYLRKFYRALGGNTALLLERTPITPNQVTLLSTLLAFISFGCLYYQQFIASAILLFLSMVLDKADGSLARLRGTSTSLGNWLDSTTDYLQISIMFIAIGFFLQKAIFTFSYSSIYHALPLLSNISITDLTQFAWIVALSSLLVYNATKYLFVFFKKYFAQEADSIVEKEKSNHPLRSCFHINEIFVNNVVFIGIIGTIFHPLFLLYTLLAFVLYGILFFSAMYTIFTYQAYKKNKTYTKEEQLKTKF